MTSLRYLEAFLYRAGLLFLLRGGWLWSLLFLLEGTLSIGSMALKERGQIDVRAQLEELSAMANALREGDAPLHAAQKSGIRHYPQEFIAPSAEHFTLEIFEKQLRLFEKKLLLEEEIAADFAASSLRMSIMKYLPILSMLLLESFSGAKAPLLLRLACAGGLLLNYHIASYLERRV